MKIERNKNSDVIFGILQFQLLKKVCQLPVFSCVSLFNRIISLQLNYPNCSERVFSCVCVIGTGNVIQELRNFGCIFS